MQTDCVNIIYDYNQARHGGGGLEAFFWGLKHPFSGPSRKHRKGEKKKERKTISKEKTERGHVSEKKRACETKRALFILRKGTFQTKRALFNFKKGTFQRKKASFVFFP